MYFHSSAGYFKASSSTDIAVHVFYFRCTRGLQVTNPVCGVLMSSPFPQVLRVRKNFDIPG